MGDGEKQTGVSRGWRRLPVPRRRTALFAVLTLSMTAVGCTHTVTMDQLQQKNMEHMTETVDWWYYMGSEDGYHYFRQVHTIGSGTYRVADSELAISDPFPLTGDKSKWVPLPWGTTEACGFKVDHNLLPPSQR